MFSIFFNNHNQGEMIYLKDHPEIVSYKSKGMNLCFWNCRHSSKCGGGIHPASLRAHNTDHCQSSPPPSTLALVFRLQKWEAPTTTCLIEACICQGGKTWFYITHAWENRWYCHLRKVQRKCSMRCAFSSEKFKINKVPIIENIIPKIQL